MIKIYKNTENDKTLKDLDNIEEGTWIDLSMPTDEEVNEVIKKTGVDEHLIKSVLDEEETSHIDTESDQLLISLNMPFTEVNSKGKLYSTMPIGVISVNNYIITISLGSFSLLDMLSKKKTIVGEISTYKKSRLIFQILYITSSEFINYLTYISKDMDTFEDNLTKSVSNSELLKLVNYQKSMIYFNNSLKSNESVMERLSRGKLIKLYDEDEDILEDAVIENKQAIEMSTTYTEILNGLTEVFGTIVSNNLNNVMKLLTSITFIISIPTLVASILGMNVIFPFDTGVTGFYVIMLFTLVISIIVTIWLKKKNLL